MDKKAVRIRKAVEYVKDALEKRPDMRSIEWKISALTQGDSTESFVKQIMRKLESAINCNVRIEHDSYIIERIE